MMMEAFARCKADLALDGNPRPRVLGRSSSQVRSTRAEDVEVKHARHAAVIQTGGLLFDADAELRLR